MEEYTKNGTEIARDQISKNSKRSVTNWNKEEDLQKRWSNGINCG